MSGLKSAWEISLEKSDKIDPELKKRKKLTEKQKARIAEIRKEYEASVADKDVSINHKIKKVIERVPPEQQAVEIEKLKMEFLEEKEKLEKEMENKVEAIRNS